VADWECSKIPSIVMMVDAAECDFAFIIFAKRGAEIEGEDWLSQALINHVIEGRNCEIDGRCGVAQTKDAVHLPEGGTPPCHLGRFCEVLLHDRKLANSQCVLGHETSNAIFLGAIIYFKKGAILVI